MDRILENLLSESFSGGLQMSVSHEKACDIFAEMYPSYSSPKPRPQTPDPYTKLNFNPRKKETMNRIETPSQELSRKFLKLDKNLLQELRRQVAQEQARRANKKQTRESRLIDAMACASSQDEFEKHKQEYSQHF